MEMLRDWLIQLAYEHWQLIALAVGGIAALGTLLGTLKKLASAIFSASLAAGEKWTGAVMSQKGRRVAVPLALAATLFGTGYLAGASKVPAVEYITLPPKVLTRDVVKQVEVVKEVKVPTFIEKIIEVPMRAAKQEPNAKCFSCAALLYLQGKDDDMFRCGGCGSEIVTRLAKNTFLFRRNMPLVTVAVGSFSESTDNVVMPIGRDPIPKPTKKWSAEELKDSTRDFRKMVEDDYAKELLLWEDQCRRYIKRD